MQAAILSIGDELVLGQTVDTNSAWLAQELIRRGISTLLHQTVADDRQAIARALVEAATLVDVVLVSGGLGPTEDDLTRHALADAMGEDLVEDAKAVADLEAFFGARNRTMPQRNRVQAMHPRGTTMIDNPNGTAPGMHGQLHNADIYVMPGVPREMKAMFQDSVLPDLIDETSTRTILATKINTFGLGESDLARRLGNLMDRNRNPKVGTTVSDGICSVRVRSEAADEATAQKQLDDTMRLVADAVGPTVFGRDEETLADAVIEAALASGKTIATAESCTGGMVSKYLTDVSGSSNAYLGGWVVYQNEMKCDQLGVDPALIEAHGVVSEPVANAMSIGAMQRSGADVAVSLTGIAGPDGGSDEKPVGTVWISLAYRGEDGQATAEAFHMLHRGGRAMVRDRSAKAALQLIRFHCRGLPVDEIQWLSRPTSSCK